MEPVILICAVFALALAARKPLDKWEKKDPTALSVWEQELAFQLLISDLQSIRLAPYKRLLTGHEPDSDNSKFRLMVSELMTDARQASDALERILSPRAFVMIMQEAARLQSVWAVEFS